MPCYRPIPALRDGTKVLLHPRPASSANMQLPCGNCVGCKVARAQEWASRCMHELREHHSAVFATLTYDDEHLPKDGQLVPSDLALFLKRLRKVCESPLVDWITVNTDGPYVKRLRFLACGEYGEQFGRPHYHAILFGVGFSDSIVATPKLSRSPGLEKVWGKGTVNFGQVTRASCAYVAGYVHKSMGRNYCDTDGVVKVAPFLRCSKGIGKLYATKYADDFRNGFLVVDGDRRKIPRYYKKVLGPSWDKEVKKYVGGRPDVLEDAEIAASKMKRDPRSMSPEGLEAGEVIAKRRRELSHTPTL